MQWEREALGAKPMSEPRFKAQVIDGEVMLHLWTGPMETLTKLSDQQARDLAQVLLATADEARGPDARFPSR